MTSGRERPGSATLHVYTRNMPFSQNNCLSTVKDQPEAEKIVIIQDNQSTHNPGSFYKAFGPEEAHK